MRNFITASVDSLSTARPGRRLDKHRLRRTLGRGLVVTRRRARGRAGIAGLILTGGGVGSLIWTSLNDFSLEGLGRVALMIGVILLCSDWLNERSASHNETFKIGYDLGFDDGDRNGRQASHPVVVPLRRPCNCGRGESEASSAVASTADRG